MSPVAKCSRCDGIIFCSRCFPQQHRSTPANIHGIQLNQRRISTKVIIATIIAAIAVIWTDQYMYPHQMNTTHGEICYIYGTGKGLWVAVVNESVTVTLHVVNQTGEECSKRIETLTCELSSVSKGETPSCTVKKIDVGPVYEIEYRPFSRGKHQLSVKFKGDGEHIKEKTFKVFVLRKLGTPIQIITGVTAPQGMAFNERGEMIVAEYREHQVSIFSSSGEKRSIGKKGSQPREFYYPCDVTVDSSGNILVADGKNHRIQNFSYDGQFNSLVGRQGTKQLEFDFPVGIGSHPRTKMIYVTENKNNRIQILNPDLTFFGYLHGDFNQPKDLAFDNTGNVYVADNENHQVQVFTEDGKFLRRFGREGTDEGELNYPTGVSVDSDGVVYVVELYNYRVSLFTQEGKFLTTFGSKGSGPGQFINPRGIAVDKNGIVYISDHENERIQLF